jgi:diguanylate cyclase (GGDEF)-like protein/putative nucleotidyltransferase with HDIG domain
VSHRRGPRRQWTLAAGGALFAFLLAYVLVPFVLDEPSRTRVADVMGLVPPVVVAVLCVIAVRSATTARFRWFWGLFALAYISWGLGAAARAYYEVIQRIAVPYPSVVDIGLLAYLGFAFAGLSLLVPQRGKAKTPGGTLLFDVVLFAVTAAAVCWELIIAPSYEAGVSAQVNLANLGYSVGDTLIVVVLVSLLLTSGRSPRPRGIKWVGGCLVIWVAAHVTSAVLWWNSLREAGVWLDPFWVLGSTFAGVGVLLFIRSGGRAEELGASGEATRPAGRATDLVRMSLPYAAIPSIAALLCVRFIIRDGGWQGDLATVCLALLLTGMVLFRQWLVVSHTRKLQTSLAALSQELENRVVERTAELATEKEHLAMLNRVAEQISQCLTARDVIGSGLRLVREPAGCSQSAIWLTGSGERGRLWGGGELSPAVRQQFLSALDVPDLVGRVSAKGETVCIAGAELQTHGAEGTGAPVLQSVVALPLVSRRAVLGLLCLGFEGSDRLPTDEALSLARGVASQIAVALENAKRYDDAQRLAERDPVTELLNSRGLARALDRELLRSRRSGRPFSLVAMDMDNFKLFNDVHGHAVGDQALRQIAAVLKKTLRGSDTIARQGGDEFMAVLPDTSTPSALECVRHVQGALRTVGFRADEKTAVPLSMSFGIAAFPADGSRVGELLAVADSNVYRSKQGGGNCVTPAVAQEQGDEPAEAGVFTVLEGLVVAVDNKDHYTRQHSDDVTRYALSIAERLGLSLGTTRPLRIAGLLHDVGKIGIPDHILRKPGALDTEEFEAIKQHVSLGEVMLREVPDLNDVLAAVGAHHERWDGGGYPRGLAGQGIPLLGRILAVADAYSAMTTDRPYRKALSETEAREEMRRVAGAQLDSELVLVFLDSLDSSARSDGSTALR